jgi:hypothetical protein
MYLWLKDLTEEEQERLVEVADLATDEKSFGKLRIEKDRVSGRQYIRIYDDETEADSIHPEIKRRMKKVTLREEIYAGFVADGVYRLGKAQMTVKTERKFLHSGDYSVEVETSQQLIVSAPTLKTLKRIYSRVRSHQLEPAEKWADLPAHLRLNRAADNKVVEAEFRTGDTAQ